MTARRLWSPSRIKTALQCGRHLQGQEEGWERGKDSINVVRGRAVHTAVEQWEDENRNDDLIRMVADAWISMVEDDAHRTVVETVRALWAAEAELAAAEQAIVNDLSDQYKNVRATKAFKERTADLAPQREHAADQRELIEGMIAELDWPWEWTQSLLVQGFDHSLETVRRGTAYLAELWPDPDIIGHEWHLQADLGEYAVHGFIDRVEGSGGVVEVVDYKSSQFEDTELDHWLQVATYAHTATAKLGFPPDRVRLVYLRDQASVAFEVQEGWSDSLLELVRAADRVLADKAFAPSFAGCGICDFVGICRDQFQLVEISEGVT